MTFVAEIREGLGISWNAIRANKLRSALTTLGIVIGVVTVTLMGTAIEGLNRAFLNSVSTIGADVLFVQRFSWFIDSHEEWMKAHKRREITPVHARALQRQLTMARAIAPVATTREPVNYRNKRSDGVSLIGTTDQFEFTKGIVLKEGRFITAAEAEGGRPVCVIGFQIATNLFVHEEPIGARIRVRQNAYEVVGVMDKQGDFFGDFGVDNAVIIPLAEMMNSFLHRPDIEIQVKVRDLARIDEAKEELRGAMRKIRHRAPGDEDDFSIDQQEMFINTFRRVAGTIAAVGLFITGLSLFVGGIGIMNIMFVSVAERTREIGIRKAIGAKRRTILIQFLSEAATICVLSGVLAVLIAWPITLVLSKFLPASMSITVVTIALLVSALTGIVSGFLPAWRASKMNPVDALRNE